MARDSGIFCRHAEHSIVQVTALNLTGLIALPLFSMPDGVMKLYHTFMDLAIWRLTILLEIASWPMFLRGSQVCKSRKKIPEELDKITDVVLAYRPKPKSKAAKRRKRKAKKSGA